MVERVLAPGEHTDDEESWVPIEWFKQHEEWNRMAIGQMRTFQTGATRDQDTTKPDYEGYISPLVTKRFGEYMTLHRKQADGKLRESDNWQKGIPRDAYIKSLYRHFLDLLLHHDGYHGLAVDPDIESVLCAIRFNVDGYLHETLKARIAAQKASELAGMMGCLQREELEGK